MTGFQPLFHSLNFFPSQTFELFPNLQHIFFASNNLPTLEAGTFANYYNLRSLVLHANEISIIQAGAFNGLTLLVDLNLQYNRISSLPARIFDQLLSLEVLTLHFNQITRLESNLLLNNRQLTHVVLSSNSINHIARNVFDNTRQLQSLLLEMNTCINLNFLNIRDGDLTNILPQFSGCFGVSPVTCEFNETRVLGISELGYTCTVQETTLTKDQNKIEFGGNHSSGSTNIDVVNLRIIYSQIPFFMTQMFTTFRNLRAVEISNGGLESIRASDFLGGEMLESIYMQYNNIKVLNGGIFAGLSRLQKLSLSKNEIEFIDGNAFSGLSSLRLLYLNDNRIRRLHRNTLNSLTELRDLSLGRNYLTRISSLLFFRNRELGYIMMDYNQISAIEGDFLENLPRLAVLNLPMCQCSV